VSAEPLVTIGIPFVNNQASLPAAVRSVFAQTFEHWELILVDDGSTDGSLEFAYAIADPRIRVVSDGINRGLAVRLNQIAQLAQGSLLARMDADDLMHPDRLMRQVDYLRANQGVDVAGSAAYITRDGTTPVGLRCRQPLATTILSALKYGLFVHPTITGRVGWFRQHPYSLDYPRNEDRELWVRTVRESRFGHVPEPLLFYRDPLENTLSKIIVTESSGRRITRRYGPSHVGRMTTGRLLLRSAAKEAAYRIGGFTGQTSLFIERRNEPLTEADRTASEQAIAKICATRIPGIDGRNN
jgi:glycosyltransferase involved in cell wall biosynthesis